MSLLDELGTLDPWLYRGWLYLLSSRYRSARHDTWRHSGPAYAVCDIALSAVVMGVEVVAAILVVWWGVGVIRVNGRGDR
jgi:hypothetical protein